MRLFSFIQTMLLCVVLAGCTQKKWEPIAMPKASSCMGVDLLFQGGQ